MQTRKRRADQTGRRGDDERQDRLDASDEKE